MKKLVERNLKIYVLNGFYSRLNFLIFVLYCFVKLNSKCFGCVYILDALIFISIFKHIPGHGEQSVSLEKSGRDYPTCFKRG